MQRQTSLWRRSTRLAFGVRRRLAILHPIAICSGLVAILLTAPAFAQQVQSGVSSGAVDIPQTNLVPITPPPSGFAPATSGGFGSFDPYAAPGAGIGASSSLLGPGGVATTVTPGTTALGAPIGTPVVPSNTIPPSPPGGSLFSRIFSPASGPVYGTPGPGTVIGAPQVYDAPSIYAPQPGYPAVADPFPGTAYPSAAPSTLFPDGVFPNGVYPIIPVESFRFFRGPRLQHGFVSRGSKPQHLGMNDTDVSLVLQFPNFCYTARPLLVIPSFSLHLWDGPDGNVISADLPPNAYSAFIDTGWESDPMQMFSTEFGIRVGIFTDFDTNNSDSIRVLGKALAAFRLSPMTTLKAGVFYLDRNSVKLVPAGGFFCRPNPHTRIDLFFPLPKFARYCRTVGTRDVWWYLKGDYGGGSWTIQRTDTTSDSIDINDLRAILGFEWGTFEQFQVGRRTAFFEVGWVFNREVEYRFNPQDNYDPGDGVMIRAGFGY